jgi:mRNA interferase MazF
MSSFKTGAVVLVKFPFTNLESVKKRPALVLKEVKFTSKINLILIAMITSQIEKIRIEGDTELLLWEKSGLIHPSIVRLSKNTTIEDTLIEKQLGRLTPSDLEKVAALFRKLHHWAIP